MPLLDGSLVMCNTNVQVHACAKWDHNMKTVREKGFKYDYKLKRYVRSEVDYEYDLVLAISCIIAPTSGMP